MSSCPVALFGSLALVLFLAAPANAQGGPPLITDDPDTPGPGYWEINIPMIMESSADGRHFDAPFPDINYGVGKRIQLKFEMPWVTLALPEHPVRTGIGNSNSGVKWRFLGEEGKFVSWSIYPQLELNMSEASAAKDLVERHAQCFFPTEFTVQSRGRFEINGEVGRRFVRDSKDGWAAGVTTEIGDQQAVRGGRRTARGKRWGFADRRDRQRRRTKGDLRKVSASSDRLALACAANPKSARICESTPASSSTCQSNTIQARRPLPSDRRGPTLPRRR